MPVAEVLDLLRCPLCGGALSLVEVGVQCPGGHRFDLARQGYLNLLASRPPRHADSAAMVAARDRFLGAGHYRPVADALADQVGAAVTATHSPDAPALLEAGAGPGYYLAHLLDALGGRGVATDISVAAARRAARAHPRLGAVVADSWQRLPLSEGRFDAVTSVFAPRNPSEFVRVLRPAGVLGVVSPLPDHLVELRRALDLLEVEEDKQQRLSATLSGGFAPLGERRVNLQVSWPASTVRDLVAMGPNAFHLSAEQQRDRVAQLPDPVAVTIAVAVSTWRRRS